jgi:hypothetical protein
MLGHPGVILTEEVITAVEGAMVPEQGSTTSQACCHAPPYSTENGSNPTWLQNAATPVDLHFKIRPFIDTKLPAMYAAPATHMLGHPGVVLTDVMDTLLGFLVVGLEVLGIDVVGLRVASNSRDGVVEVLVVGLGDLLGIAHELAVVGLAVGL